MRRRILSLALSGLVILSLTGTAFGQAVQAGRFDQIVDFASIVGVPPVAEGTFVPTVQATDAESAAIGSTLSPYVTDLDAWFAANFGWRSSKPVTFLLASSGEEQVNLGIGLTGGAIDRLAVLSRPAFLVQATQSSAGVAAGDWAILVNTDLDAATAQSNSINNALNSEIGLPPVPRPITTDEGIRLIQQSMARELASLMETDVAGTAGPTSFREGLADAISFRVVPGTPLESGRPLAVVTFQSQTGTLPSLSDLSQAFNIIAAPGGLSLDMARGLGFLSASVVLNQAGGVNALDILRSVAAGQSYESALQAETGFSLFTLNNATQLLIPSPSLIPTP